MYEFIRGNLITINEAHAVIDVGGIGYKIHTPSSYASCPELPREEILLYISFQVRELSHTLYGFLSTVQRDFFETLITVSGVGPKTALLLVGMLSIDEFTQAVLSGNITTITKVPGIGKKTAERLIVEIKDKIPKLFQKQAQNSTPTEQPLQGSKIILDAVSALINLGYQRAKAEQAIQKALNETNEKTSVQEIIAVALRYC
jgi:holliday junction DNA helicase RuvA